VTFFDDLFREYTPRAVCMDQEATVIWLHLVSDVLIALAYYSIPLTLLYFVRKRTDLQFSWIFACVAIFILAGGTTHVMDVVALWHPMYRLDGLIKAVTAVASVGIAILLVPIIRRAIAIPSPNELRLANAELAREVADRVVAQDRLSHAQKQLERRVDERTVELQRANVELRSEADSRRELSVAHARLAAIVESSDDAIVGKNLDGIITSWNRGAERLFGYSAAEMIGQSILKIVPLDRGDEEKEILARLRRDERIDHFETLRRAKDGRLIDVSITVSPIRDSTGIIIGASKIARDITLQKRIAKERETLLANERAARSDAERASRMKDEFLATLSHELRTPLTSILGWSQILREHEGKTPEVEQGLEVIERNTRVQVQLIEELLDMSRIVSGKIRLEIDKIDLSEVIRAAVDAVTPAADAKGVRLQSVLDPHAGPFAGDAARLQQVVWNLLTNAIRFTPRGGRVQVFLERVDSHLELSVVDTGEGIPPEFLPHVFDRFRQADSSTTRRHGGLGLGLSIVRHLVELHGGTVRVHSAGRDQGSSFVVSLPLRVVKQQQPLAYGMSAAMPGAVYTGELPSLAGVHVLVIDDEPDARELVARILRKAGAEADTAPSAEEGLAMLRRTRPDIVISDIGMPEEDGYGFVRRLRKLSHEEGGDTPAVALTAFARSEDRRMALMSGFQMHVSKPAEASELVVVVATLAGRMAPTPAA